MLPYILLAFLNGAIIGTSRAVNGKLSTKVGPFKASLWNHVVGFLFLTLVLLVMNDWKFDEAGSAPFTAYLGGFFGALFVAVNSYVFPRLGAMTAALMVISGQMITAVLIDYQSRDEAPGALRCLGVVIVIAGVYLSRVVSASQQASQQERQDT
ncbi:DMT family transporter [Streptomyces sp. UNOC14_S4]|uniref:DMT family transporter n=1 Tax=Streptomyces sp. UNOC14_S4 TaxID=2872340 RepID=UPI001E2D9EEA|nr:DMT family transporter [Streptomyces sp. UNOC14_S4]MCC3768666.1 DMT family transporter [Streptomyces sp. UNOC14_S4]